MPYLDINPHRTRPKWRAYLGLAVLAVLTAGVVVLALVRW